MNRVFNVNSNFDFSYKLTNFDVITTKNYLEAVDKITKNIEKTLVDLNLKKIGLCLSGLDSEIIANSLSKSDIYVEFFFLKIENVNIADLELAEKISKKYKKILNVVSITIEELLDYEIFNSFNITKVCWPTYVSIPFLIKKIPDDFFIILGEGDLEKTNNDKYSRIFNLKNLEYSNENFYIPMHLSEIAYKTTIDFYGKNGESNFFTNSFDAWYHILKDDNLITDEKIFYDPKTKILSSLAKENNFVSPIKTLNYNENFFNLKIEIINKLIDYGKNFQGWHAYIGDVIILPKDLIK